MTLKEFIRSEDTESAFRFFVGASLPLLVCTWLGYPQTGIFMLLGATFVFGIDVPIALPKKLGFMVLSGFLSTGIFLLFTQISSFPVLNGLLLFGVLFFLNFISPFSPNFSTVALLLNLSVMIGLSMAGSVANLGQALTQSGYLLLGSGWYILYALLLHPLQRPKQLRRRLQDCLRLTASYIAEQAALLEASTDLSPVLLRLAQKQSELVGVHQQIREVLLREPINLTNPDTFMGRATYFLAHLVDLDELATALTLSLHALGERPEKDDVLPLLRTLNARTVAQLHQLEAAIARNDAAGSAFPDLEAAKALEALTQHLDSLRVRTASHPQAAEAYRHLRRMERYIAQQALVLQTMQQVLARKSASLDLAHDRLSQFASYDTLEWSYLRSHLSLQSGFFRYALRMALTAVGAYYLASALGFDYPSWALLTVLVILKPGFHPSRQRLAHRVYGTLAGLVAGLSMHYLIQPTPGVSMAIFLTSQFFAFSFIKRQYAVTTGFFTLFILFFYSYLQREFMSAAYFRLVDTLMAAGLCWLAMRFVFPYWETQNLPAVIGRSLRANRNLLDAVLQEEPNPTTYKLLRKEAFLKIDDLLNSYRILQTEASAQADLLHTAQRIVLLVHTQLAQIMSMGLFLQRTSPATRQSPAIRHFLQKAMTGMDALIAFSDPQSSGESETRESIQQELKERRHEINELLVADSSRYLAKVHELFWVESALELMEITEKLRVLLPQSSVAATAD